MKRNLLQDMVRVKNPIKIEERETKRDLYRVPVVENSNKSKYRLFFVAIVSVIFLLFALSYLFSGAKITLTPKVKEIPLNNENISASKDGSNAGLPFDIVVISGEENKTIQGGEQKEVENKAIGSVLIYNSYSSSPQTFGVDTKLEGSNGKIYKTSKKVVVPGMTKDGKPQSIEVGIYASVAGPEYNSTPIDFKFLSFKGTSKYSKFYARSKGEITGGFKGKASVVSSLDKEIAVSELKATLETKLSNKAIDQIPSGFILFKDAAFLDIKEKDISFNPEKDNTVVLNIKATLYGFIFNEEKLIKKLSEDIIENYDGSDVYIPNIRDLTFTLANKESISFADVNNISFNLKGNPKIIWKIDEIKFVSDILDKKKKDFNQILTQYPNIDSAQLVLRPFWKASFPETNKNIQVIINYPK